MLDDHVNFQMTLLYGRVDVRIMVTKPDGMDVSGGL